jgi:hypothetical protein
MIGLMSLNEKWFLIIGFQARAKHDMTNTVVAGCVTGGAISAKGNPFLHHLSILSMFECITTGDLHLEKSILQISPSSPILGLKLLKSKAFCVSDYHHIILFAS